MGKKVESIKHKTSKRAHIPSKEEAGYEEENPKVKGGNKTLELPKNPVVHRGQDPELFWLNKYGNDDREDLLKVDIRSLYRHEHIAPETLIKNLYRVTEEQSNQLEMFSANDLFGNALEKDELDKVSEYYEHQDGWTNRLIQGDSHLVMASLLEREGMAGQVQMIYIDPPYGISYNKNWQININDRNIGSDTQDIGLTGEPEMIKAFRDTWELGIHSYLSYLRDRLLIAKELLTDSGSCFVQISDENVHLVRNVMDEIFGSENFCNQITFQKTGSISSKGLGSTIDYVIWYAKRKEHFKYRQLFTFRKKGETTLDRYDYVETPKGEIVRITAAAIRGEEEIPEGKRCRFTTLLSDGEPSVKKPFVFKGNKFELRKGKHWKTDPEIGGQRLISKNRIVNIGNTLWYKRYVDDFPVIPISDRWESIQIGQELSYVVQM